MKWITVVALSVVVSAQHCQAAWTADDEAALQKLLNAKTESTGRIRREIQKPGIKADQGDVVLLAGTGGHISYEIDGVRASIDEMPALHGDAAKVLQVGFNVAQPGSNADGDVVSLYGAGGETVGFEVDGTTVDSTDIPEGMQGYMDTSAQILQVGYNMGKAVNAAILTAMEEVVEPAIKEVQDGVDASSDLLRNLESTIIPASIAASEESQTEATIILVAEAVAGLQTKLDDQGKTVATNEEYVVKAKACGASGKGVGVVGGKLVCVETKPMADATASCTDGIEGKISVRNFKSGANTLKGMYICADKTWQKLHTFISKEARELGSTIQKKAASCKQIVVGNPEATTGKYFVTQGNGKVLPVICLMDSAYKGGGWQLLMTSTHPSSMIGGSNFPMGSVNINADSPTLTSRYTRNWVNVCKPAIGDEFMILQKEGLWKTFEMTHTFCGFNSRDKGVCTGCHGTFAKGQIYNEDGSKVNCGSNGCWFNSCTVCGGCSSRGCDSIAFNADHRDYAAWYGGSQWKVFGSGWDGNCVSGWDRRKYDIHPINVLWRPKN